jgi:hypothetical protein
MTDVVSILSRSINPPMAGIESLIQPTETLKVAPHMQ